MQTLRQDSYAYLAQLQAWQTKNEEESPYKPDSVVLANGSPSI